MLGHVLLTVTLCAFGLPKSQIGTPYPKQQTEATDQLLRQVAVAPVQSVGGHEVVLRRPGAPLRIGVDEDTPVFTPRGPGALSDLRPGLRVRVSYDAYHGPPQANWVEILPAPLPRQRKSRRRIP